ncbi:MAG: translocation/assembly module TamB domain-containing protein, partial [Deltaproteobacteria bacterium]|nr:translocation/assembly module TamB domain-containing protein [Deltaproteobacteria bacterium]
MRKRWIIAFCLLGILALGAVALWWAQSAQGLRVLANLASSRLRAQYGIELQFGEISADVAAARIAIEDMAVVNASGERLFSARRLLAEMTPVQMLTGRLRLDRLVIEAPKVRAAIVGGRLSGLPQVEGGHTTWFRISVAEMLVRDAAFDLAIEDDSLLSLREIDVLFAGSDLARHRFSFSVGGGSYDRADQRLRLAAFSGQGTQIGDDLLALGRLEFDRVLVAVDELRAEFAGSIDFSERGALGLPAAELAVHVDVPLAEMSRILDADVELEGMVAIEANVETGDLDTPRASGVLSASDPTIEGFRLGDATAFFEADLKRLKLDPVAYVWGGAVILGSGEVALDQQLTTEVKASGSNVCFGEILADMTLPGSWVNFYVDATAETRGHILPQPQFTGHGSGTVRELTVNDRSYLEAPREQAVLAIPALQMTSNFGFDPTKFEFSATTISDGRSAFHGNATLHFDVDRGFRVEAVDSQADLATISPIAGVDLAGVGRVSGVVAGPYPDPAVEAHADIDDFVLERYAFGHTSGTVAYRGLVLSFLKMAAHKGSSDYQAEVVLDFNDGVDLAVEAAVNDTKAEDLRAIVPPEDVGAVMTFLRDLRLTGGLTGRGVARGDIRGGTTADLTGSADLTLGPGSLYGQSFDSGIARGRLSLQTLFADAVTLHRGDGKIQASGTVQRADGALQIAAAASDLPLDRLELLENQVAPVVGRASIEASFAGTVGHVLGSGQIRLNGMAVGPLQIDSARLATTLDGVELDLAGPAFSDRGQFHGHVNLIAPFRYRAETDLNHCAVASLFTVEALPEGLSVASAIAASAQGSLSELASSRGTLRLTGLGGSYRGIEFRSPDPVEASFSGSDIDFDRLTLAHGDDDFIRLRGRLSRRTLSLEVESDLGLALAPAFTSEVTTATGRVKLSLGVSGSYRDPVLLGQGTLTDGRLVFASFEHPVEELGALFSLTRDTLLMDSASARVDGAAVEGQGELRFAGFVPRQVRLDARFLEPVTLHIPSNVTSRALGQLELAGSFDDLYLRGDVDVLSVRHTDNWDTERILPEFRRRKLAPHPFDPARERIHLDVRLHADDNLIVRNNLLDVELKGDVRLTGSNERPGMRGTLHLLRGAAQFRSNRYTLRHATVDLVDPYKIAPVIDVLAHTQTRGQRAYEVDVYLQGPLEDL